MNWAWVRMWFTTPKSGMLGHQKMDQKIPLSHWSNVDFLGALWRDFIKSHKIPRPKNLRLPETECQGQAQQAQQPALPTESHGRVAVVLVGY